LSLLGDRGVTLKATTGLQWLRNDRWSDQFLLRRSTCGYAMIADAIDICFVAVPAATQ